MSGYISTIHSEIHFLMEKALELFPGIKKVIGIAAIDNTTEILQATSDKTPIESISILDSTQYKTIEKMRETTKNLSWFSSEDLPFSITPTRPSQKLMFDELSNVVLCIPFLNQKDAKSDLILLYFNADSSNFGLSVSTSKLSTETKTVLAQIAKQSLLIHLESYKKMNYVSEEFRQTIQKLAIKYQNLKEEKNQQFYSSKDRFIKYCKQILNEISKKSGINSEFSGEALQLLENWTGNLWHVKSIIQQAFDFAWKSRIQLNLPLLVIEDWHLDLNNTLESTENEDIIKITESRFLKTYALLERLEEAAKRVIGNSQNLTGANVGNAMNQPISAAAITDSIKKNQGKIRSLCTQFPERWKIIRSEFKPITNALVVKIDLEKQIG